VLLCIHLIEFNPFSKFRLPTPIANFAIVKQSSVPDYSFR